MKSKESIDLLNKMISVVNELINVEPDDLVQLDRLGKEASFLNGKQYFLEIRRLFQDFMKVSMQFDLPNVVVGEISNIASQIKKIYDQMLSFSLSNTTNVTNLRDNLLINLNQQYEVAFGKITPLIAYFQLRNSSVSVLEIEIENRRAELNKAIKEVNQLSQAAASEAESILKMARDTAAQSGVSQHAQIFGDEAKDHGKVSNAWLKATIAAGVLTILWGLFGNWVLGSNADTTSELIKMFSSKIIVLSILTYVLVWCSKNYSASRHNVVVNKHRQNALNTFKTFVAAAGEDQEIKDAVLLQATNSIFSSQPSGYINKESDNSSNKTIEIVRTSANIAGSVGKMSKQ